MTSVLPDLHFVGDAQCFPLYWYEKEEVTVLNKSRQPALFAEPIPDQTVLALDDADSMQVEQYTRYDGITGEGLKLFREAYPHMRISKEDIFYYVYGVLHSPEYRQRFANNLAKELPRIPLARDFKTFMKAGRELADLHLHYETVDPWPVIEVGDSINPGRTVKMRYPRTITLEDTGKKVKDPTVLQVAERLTFEHIPSRAYRYVVNGKPAIDWMVERYQVTEDKKSKIVNDPNTYSDDPRYIVDLVRRVITVSVRTMDIVDSLPPLEELPKPDNWPEEWS